MKTENTLENKAKFFAQYWLQRVLRIPSDNIMPYTLQHPYLSDIFMDNDKGYYLELTPLSQITDEDAKHLRYPDSLSATTTYKNSIGRTTEESDYLRSKGYILPFLDLSVEDLISYGWVKLKSN